MNFKRKTILIFVTIALLAIVVLAAVACTPTDDNPSTNTPSQNNPSTSTPSQNDP